MINIPDDMVTGTIHKTNNFGELSVVEYSGYLSVKVKFICTGFMTTASRDSIVHGRVKDKLYPNVYGVGHIGEGKYIARVGGKITPAYRAWNSMLERCYSDKYQSKRPSYKGCSVCDEWHNFQMFAEWFEASHIEGYQLDKDIKVNGNRVYCPAACSFVSAADNSIYAQAKWYRFLSPSGVVHEIYNLAEFCRENGLSSPNMTKVSNGDRNHHKGWTSTKGVQYD